MKVTGVGVPRDFPWRLLDERLAPGNCWLSMHWGEGVPGVLGVDRAGLGPSPGEGQKRFPRTESEKESVGAPGGSVH